VLVALLLVTALGATVFGLLDRFGGDDAKVAVPAADGARGVDATPSEQAATGTAPATGTGPTDETSAGSGAEPTGDAPPPGQAVPAGFVLHQDPTGFSVAVPQGWTVDPPDGSAVRFDDPQSTASLLIDQTEEPKSDPVADWQAQERTVSGNYTDYQLVGGIRGFTLRGWQGADWEFTYAADAGRGHKLNRNLVTTPGKRAYALLWTAPDAEWQQRRSAFDTVFESFQPAP